jgi:hypothetical protein
MGAQPVCRMLLAGGEQVSVQLAAIEIARIAASGKRLPFLVR